MKKSILALFATLAISTSAYAETCKVTDPTGTPLNARATPYGKIIGKLKNGTTVYITDYDYDHKGRPWVLVFNAKNNRYIGWVYRDYLSCYY